MATWNQVSRIALRLPESTEQVGGDGLRTWRVGDKMFIWERPLRKRDLAELGDEAPRGPILGVRVPDLGAKEALLADDPETAFTTSHFNGYPAVLVRLTASRSRSSRNSSLRPGCPGHRSVSPRSTSSRRADRTSAMPRQGQGGARSMETW
jgi:hypothetical protein